VSHVATPPPACFERAGSTARIRFHGAWPRALATACVRETRHSDSAVAVRPTDSAGADEDSFLVMCPALGKVRCKDEAAKSLPPSPSETFSTPEK
jgi:hypothetical protein